MNEKNRKYIIIAASSLLVIALAVIAYLMLSSAGKEASVFGKIIRVLNPVIYGAVFAFLLAPVYNVIEKAMLKPSFVVFKKKNAARTTSKVIATLACLIIFAAILVGLGFLILPQLISSVANVVTNIPGTVQIFSNWISTTLVASAGLETSAVEMYQRITESIYNWANTDLLPNMTKYVSSISLGVKNVVSFFFDFVVGIIVMIYLLNIKEKIIAGLKKCCYGLFKIKTANGIIAEAAYVKNMFSRFIVGKIIDSAIIGVITFILTSIFRIPYALLVSTIVGITNIIPFFGPFIGGAIGGVILIMIDPLKCLYFLILVIIIQQFDGNFLGPKIIGQTTGVSSFGVLFSILLFGGLFGFAGMIIGVPTFGVIVRLVTKNVNRALEAKNLSTDSLKYQRLEKIDENTLEYIKQDGKEN